MAKRAKTNQSVAQQIDGELARAALQKRRAGGKPTGKELAALRRVEKRRNEELREELCSHVPKGVYSFWSGRQSRTLNEQSRSYGIPIGGRTIDVPAVIRWLHDFLAENARKLARVDGEDPMSGPTSPALERWREEKWRLARLERMEREQTLLPRDLVHEGLGAMATILRRAGEQLQRLHGPNAARILDEALDDWQRTIDDRLGGAPEEQDHDSHSDQGRQK